ncbi:hypothetical protein [Paraflavitalea pollutisoli]|uniref:hypothetical protein n=1 Tax=Paraflavitalea pollutisoli TaxID=3034143 RepID=UPI0023EC818A|nr:hypothetical protein [Paraflavitalea sp. H1-2-19X]
MKITHLLLQKGAAATLAAALLFTACKKDNQADDPGKDDQATFAKASTQADAESDAVFADVLSNVLGVSPEVAVGGTGVFAARSAQPSSGNKENGENDTPCFVASFTKLNGTNAFPLQVTIDFGTGCTGKDGHTRKGKVIIVYSGHLLLPGSSATTTFDGYSIDSFKVEGTHKATNTSTQDKRSFKIEVTGAKLTKPNGNFNTWGSTRTLTQTAGVSTPLNLSDDVFEVTGQATGALQLGSQSYSWQADITTPLIRKFTCPFIPQGTISISRDGKIIGVLDFGTGQCDRKAALQVNGVVFEISLV